MHPIITVDNDIGVDDILILNDIWRIITVWVLGSKIMIWIMITSEIIVAQTGLIFDTSRDINGGFIRGRSSCSDR